MSEFDPIELLRTLRPPPESEEDARRSLNGILARLVDEGLVNKEELPRQRPSFRLFRLAAPALPVILSIVLALIAILALSPAGNAVASWIGDVFGIGEPGGAPTLQAPSEVRNSPTESSGGPATVMAALPLSDGSRVEMVVWMNKAGLPCIAADLSGMSQSTWRCLSPSEMELKRAVQVDAVRWVRVGSGQKEKTFIVGRALRDVAELQLVAAHNPQSILARATPEIAHLPQTVAMVNLVPFDVFVLEIGENRGPGRALLRALGAQGMLLGSTWVQLELNGGGVVAADPSEVK